MLGLGWDDPDVGMPVCDVKDTSTLHANDSERRKLKDVVQFSRSPRLKSSHSYRHLYYSLAFIGANQYHSRLGSVVEHIGFVFLRKVAHAKCRCRCTTG